MRRKVNKVGVNTLTISLPSDWCKTFDIKKGDDLEVSEEGSSITLSKDRNLKVAHERQITVNTTADFSHRLFENPYIEGVNKLVVDFQDPDVPVLIESFLDRLLGYVITTQNKNSLVIEYMGENDPNCNSIIRKLFLILKTQLDQFPETKDLNDYFQQLITIEKNATKSINFSLRSLNTRGYRKKEKTIFVYCIVWMLEQVMDDYRAMAEAFLDKKLVFGPKEKALFIMISDYYSMFLEQLYSYKASTYPQFYAYNKAIDAHLAETPSSVKNFLLLAYLKAITEKIYHLGIMICESNHGFMTE